MDLAAAISTFQTEANQEQQLIPYSLLFPVAFSIPIQFESHAAVELNEV